MAKTGKRKVWRATFTVKTRVDAMLAFYRASKLVLDIKLKVKMCVGEYQELTDRRLVYFTILHGSHKVSGIPNDYDGDVRKALKTKAIELVASSTKTEPQDWNAELREDLVLVTHCI